MTPTEVSVRLPVLKTVKVYAIGWPAAVTVVGLADLAMESEAVWVTVTVTVLEVALVTVPPEGVVPCVVAWSTIEPWLMSAWDTS